MKKQSNGCQGACEKLGENSLQGQHWQLWLLPLKLSRFLSSAVVLGYAESTELVLASVSDK